MMIARHSIAIVVWAIACCGLVRGALGEQVEVIVDSANLCLGKEVVRTVKRGDQLEVVQRQHPWVCVRTGAAESAPKGWLLAGEVQTFVPAEVDESSTAPPGFGSVRAVVNGTHYLVTRPGALYLELTLLNDSEQVVPYDAGKIELEAGQFVSSNLLTNAAPEVMGYRSLSLIDRGAVRSQPVRELARLSAGQLAPGEKVTGWVAFPISLPPISAGPPGRPALDWKLYIPLGDDELQVDLLAIETEAVIARIRPAQSDAQVSVLELGPRINVVNFAKVEQCLDKLHAEQRGFLIRFTAPVCSVDDYARMAFRPVAERLAAGNARWIYVMTGQPGREDLRSILGSRENAMAVSEAAAAVTARAWAADGPQVLVERLSDPAEEIRLGAAASLGMYLDRQEVRTALALASRDASSRVRLVALRTLAAGLGGLPRDWPSPLGPVVPRAPLAKPLELQGDLLEGVLQGVRDPQADVRAGAAGLLYYAQEPRGSEAVIAALRDTDALVQANAASAAARHPTDAVRAEIVAQLKRMGSSPRDITLARSLCQTAAQIQATDAETSLLSLAETSDRYLRARAIDALRELGCLSPSAAALAKLKCNQARHADWQALVRAADEETIQQLRELAKNTSSGPEAVTAACILAERKDPTVRTTLFDLLAQPNNNGMVPLAIGKLGDASGVEPLQEMLQKRSFQSNRAEILLALWLLKAPGADQRIREELGKPNDDNDTRRLITLLCEHAGEAAVPLIAPLLDRASLAGEAAASLWRMDTADARTLLKRRLSDDEYPNAATIIRSVAHHLTEPFTPDELSQREKEIQTLLSFFAELGDAASPPARQAIANQLRLLERMIPQSNTD